MRACTLLYLHVLELQDGRLDGQPVGAGIDLRAGGGAEHLEFIGRGREGDVAVYQHCAVGIFQPQASHNGQTRQVLLAEAQGILLP